MPSYKSHHALLIGVGDYRAGWPQLPRTLSDVDAVAAALEDHGFLITRVTNPTYRQLLEAVRDFVDRHGFDPENRLLIYFAGHGFTLDRSYGGEMGFIVPSDAPHPRQDRRGFLSRAVSMLEFDTLAQRIEANHVLFLFDSCFAGSIFSSASAASAHLARGSSQPPPSIAYKLNEPVRQFITSGSAGETVPDKSIFRDRLLRALAGEDDLDEDGYILGTELGRFLEREVVAYSRGAQHPQHGKIRHPHLDRGDFVFENPRRPPGPTLPMTPAPPVLPVEGKAVAAPAIGAWEASGSVLLHNAWSLRSDRELIIWRNPPSELAYLRIKNNQVAEAVALSTDQQDQGVFSCTFFVSGVKTVPGAVPFTLPVHWSDCRIPYHTLEAILGAKAVGIKLNDRAKQSGGLTIKQRKLEKLQSFTRVKEKVAAKSAPTG